MFVIKIQMKMSVYTVYKINQSLAKCRFCHCSTVLAGSVCFNWSAIALSGQRFMKGQYLHAVQEG